MATYYHGSPQSGLTVLEPRRDERLGIDGVFVSDERFGPELFALIPGSADADVDYDTCEGEFVRGTVRTPALNDEGWLYRIEADECDVEASPEGVFRFTGPVSIVDAECVTRADVESRGWEVVIGASD